MTNDVENVLRKIEHYHQGSIAGFHIMYRDPMRFWDGIQWDGKCALFFSLRETDEGAQMNPKGKAEFASLLVNWRTKHGWNREESAAKLDVPHRTLQEWEQGRRKPSKMAQRGVVSRMEVSRVEIKPASKGRNDPASGARIRPCEKRGIFLSNKPDINELMRACLEEKCRLTQNWVAGSFRPLLAGL